MGNIPGVFANTVAIPACQRLESAERNSGPRVKVNNTADGMSVDSLYRSHFGCLNETSLIITYLE